MSISQLHVSLSHFAEQIGAFIIPSAKDAPDLTTRSIQ